MITRYHQKIHNKNINNRKWYEFTQKQTKEVMESMTHYPGHLSRFVHSILYLNWVSRAQVHSKDNAT